MYTLYLYLHSLTLSVRITLKTPSRQCSSGSESHRRGLLVTMDQRGELGIFMPVSPCPPIATFTSRNPNIPGKNACPTLTTPTYKISVNMHLIFRGVGVDKHI